MRGASQDVYGVLAPLYDKLYHWKDYPAEAGRVTALLAELGVSPSSRLLEVACGTGLHLESFAKLFKCQGLDLSPAMLAEAKRRLPDVPLHQGDMADLATRDLGCELPVDAVVSLFSSIGYLYPHERLVSALTGFARALRPGGVAIVEPWITPDVYEAGKPSLHTYEDDDLKLARATVAEQVGPLSLLVMHYLIARRDQPVTHVTDTHALALYTEAEMRSAFQTAGLDARYEPDGLMPQRGLWVATKPA